MNFGSGDYVGLFYVSVPERKNSGYAAIRGSPLEKVTLIFSPIITNLTGLVDIGLIRMYTKLERKTRSEVDFYLP